VILVVVILAIWFVVGTGVLSSAIGFGAPGFFIAAICGILVFGIAFAVLGFSRGLQTRHLPPPPPIQQPMIPLGNARPAELACPNCGAPPKSVDRFGIAICDYCETRFLAR